MFKRFFLTTILVFSFLIPFGVTSGYEGIVATLYDDTSIMIEANVAHLKLAAKLKEHGILVPGLMAKAPGLLVKYFDNNLLMLMPVTEKKVIETAAGKKVTVMGLVVFFKKPAGFDKRWPLHPTVKAGMYFLVADTSTKKGKAYVVTVKVPRDAYAIPVRHPEYGSTPGAMMERGDVHPFITQMKNGCVFGIGLVPESKRLIVCDLVK